MDHTLDYCAKPDVELLESALGKELRPVARAAAERLDAALLRLLEVP